MSICFFLFSDFLISGAFCVTVQRKGERSGRSPSSRTLLPFPEGRADGFSAVVRSAASDIHPLRRTSVIRVIDTFDRLTVDGNHSCRIHGSGRLPLFSLLRALAAGILLLSGILGANQDIALAA